MFKRREDVEAVLRDLKSANYDMNRVSLIARHVDKVEGSEEVTENRGDTEAQEGAGIGASTGTVLGGLSGFLIGVGVLAIPGVGPILAAGAEINALAATLAGAGVGAAAGGIVGALVGLGIPEEQAKSYNSSVKAGHYLLMVSGTADELRRVESVLRDRHVEDFNIYDAPDLAQTSTTPTRGNVASTPNREQMATGEVLTERREASRTNATETRDIDQDGEPEVFIVDKRNETQRKPTR
ncbi:signal transduction histidine kinase (STHK), LytS [Oculatella sp. LEGE 06141]|uniref:signal transduction histidine kinase (STHK), LytS n=1 Tax=Oculatella sp. LEGE 06141 TaxID=1828648 RepID=UPI001D1466C6|nr:signal transduction histidine kinase (STHK), LytS [Oculatella sp. LEGE 06141]